MTLIELRYIVELANEQHFGRAAERCDVSQPTLSVAVKKLEEELGLALFERTKSGVRLTAMGERITAQARALLHSVADINALAASGRDQLSSPLRLGAINTVAPYVLPQLIPYLQQQWSSMPLLVQEDTTPNLRYKLRHSQVDAVLVSLPFSEPDVVVQELYEEPLVMIMPQSHPLAVLPALDERALVGQSLLLLAEDHCLRAQTLALFPALLDALPAMAGALPDAVQIANVAQVNSLETLRGMVAAGLGLAVVPRSAATQSICLAQRLAARPLAMPGARRKLALAWRASFPRHRAIDALRKAIQVCSGAYWSFTTEPEPPAQSAETVGLY